MFEFAHIEPAIQAGLLSPAARDMPTQNVLQQYADANALDLEDAAAELSVPARERFALAFLDTSPAYEDALYDAGSSPREFAAWFAVTSLDDLPNALRAYLNEGK